MLASLDEKHETETKDMTINLSHLCTHRSSSHQQEHERGRTRNHDLVLENDSVSKDILDEQSVVIIDFSCSLEKNECIKTLRRQTLNYE
jgi:hypothetical protein